MKKYFLLPLLILSLQAVQSMGQQALTITPLNSDYYIYTTYQVYDGQPFPANGMYVLTTEGAIIFDTPWDTTQFQPLLDSILLRHGQKAVMCISTHFHSDRTAGLEYFRNKGIATWSTAQTYDLCSRNNEHKPAHIFSGDTVFHIGNKSFRAFYPGGGHTKDNIVAWFPEDRVLYGGCFIKSTDSKDLGNVADADLKAWPASIKRVIKACADPAYIIPGHQGWADKNALQHTLTLLRRHKRH